MINTDKQISVARDIFKKLFMWLNNRLYLKAFKRSFTQLIISTGWAISIVICLKVGRTFQMWNLLFLSSELKETITIILWIDLIWHLLFSNTPTPNVVCCTFTSVSLSIRNKYFVAVQSATTYHSHLPVINV